MFSVAIMLSALKLLSLEIRNLSAITTGVEQGVPTDAILSNLVRPE
jgi:V/A-type H+/Na+-transporting ATPase subunit C